MNVLLSLKIIKHCLYIEWSPILLFLRITSILYFCLFCITCKLSNKMCIFINFFVKYYFRMYPWWFCATVFHLFSLLCIWFNSYSTIYLPIFTSNRHFSRFKKIDNMSIVTLSFFVHVSWYTNISFLQSMYFRMELLDNRVYAWEALLQIAKIFSEIIKS